jgi:hypothetical protein
VLAHTFRLKGLNELLSYRIGPTISLTINTPDDPWIVLSKFLNSLQVYWAYGLDGIMILLKRPVLCVIKNAGIDVWVSFIVCLEASQLPFNHPDQQMLSGTATLVLFYYNYVRYPDSPYCC